MWLSRNLTSAGVRQLTALRSLTRLVFANNSFIPAFDNHRSPDFDFTLAWDVRECQLQTAPEVRACFRGCKLHVGVKAVVISAQTGTGCVLRVGAVQERTNRHSVCVESGMCHVAKPGM